MAQVIAERLLAPSIEQVIATRLLARESPPWALIGMRLRDSPRAGLVSFWRTRKRDSALNRPVFRWENPEIFRCAESPAEFPEFCRSGEHSHMSARAETLKRFGAPKRADIDTHGKGLQRIPWTYDR